MATKKKKSPKKPSTKGGNVSVEGAKVHSEVTATLMQFANPPAADPIARQCVANGLDTIGITGPFEPEFLIDFGAIDRNSCIDFGDAIVICVASKGHDLPALSGPFVILHEKGTLMTFENLVKAVAKMMRPDGSAQ